MELPDWGLFVLGMLVALLSDLCIAHYVTIPKTRRLVGQDGEALLDRKLGIKPGALTGGADASEAAHRRWDQETARARTEVAIMSALAEMVGPMKAKVAWAWLPSHVRRAALRAGEEGWFEVLEPQFESMKRAVLRRNDATQETTVPRSDY